MIDQGRHIVNDGFGLAPYAHQGEMEVGYANCTGTAGAMRLTSEKKYGGHSLLIKPVSMNNGLPVT